VAIEYQINHNGHHQNTFLLRTIGNSFWYYFPIALSMKLSIPIFVITATLLGLRRQALRNWAIASAAILFLFSLLMRLQIGIRLILPLIALLIIGIAAAVANARRASGPGWKSRLFEAEVILAIVWTGAAAWHVWPQGICYTNEFWGGTAQGYLYLSDSNYDWGQGIPDLENWRRSRGIPRIAVWYFGTDPRISDDGLIGLRPQSFPAKELTWIAESERVRYLAVGTTVVYGASDVAGPLRNLTPVDRTQTFLIYDLSQLIAEIGT
jgi:hypothetical protein